MPRKADRAVRLEDVAREAGVSIATVSHAFTGKGKVPDTTRARVREVARRMGYQPNAAARQLAGGRVGLIALVFSMPDPLPVTLTDVDYFNRAIRAATARALEHDYALVVAPPTPQTQVWSRIALDGVVAFDPVPGDPVLSNLRERGVPLVLSGRDPGSDDDYCVDNNHVAATRTVLDHLASSGARRVALLAAELGDAFTDDCVETYQSWCRARGVEPLTAMVPFGQLADAKEADDLLALPDPPDGVYANAEVLGVAMLDAARRRGVRVPDDLLIAVAAEREPTGGEVTLTTLELDPARTAVEAVDILIELIEGRAPSTRLKLIPTHLAVRESTRRPS